jgi:hypothetical protein
MFKGLLGLDGFAKLCYSLARMEKDNVIKLGCVWHGDGWLNDGSDNGSSGGNGGGKTDVDPYVSMWLPRVDPDVVAQIFAVRKNLILSDPTTSTERAVATECLSRVLQLLSFANAEKVQRRPSFYVRLLNRLMELKPDLCGIIDRIQQRTGELEKSGDDGIGDRIDMLKGAVREFVKAQAVIVIPGEK